MMAAAAALSSSSPAAAAALFSTRRISFPLFSAAAASSAGGGGGGSGGGAVAMAVVVKTTTTKKKNPNKTFGVLRASGSGANSSSNSNYVVPLDYKAMSGLTRPLAEILRDLNKRVPDNIINNSDNSIPWYHVNRMLSFYAPGWCGEVCDVIYSDNGTVTVVYRVTIRGSDGEAHRESTATVSLNDDNFEDPVAAAEEMAFCRACARFGFGLYLYHEDEIL